MVALEDLGGLDAFPGGGDLDEDAVLGDALILIQLLGGQPVHILHPTAQQSKVFSLQGYAEPFRRTPWY